MNDPLLAPKDMSFTVDEALAEAARWENGSYFDGLPAWRWALVALAKEVRRLRHTGTDYAELVKVLREDADSFRSWTRCACLEAGNTEVMANTLSDAADAIEALTRLTRSPEPGGNYQQQTIASLCDRIERICAIAHRKDDPYKLLAEIREWSTGFAPLPVEHDGLPDSQQEADGISPETGGMRAAMQRLADAADAVGVSYFDGDDLSPEVEEMQAATLAARAFLSPPNAGGEPR